MVVAIESNPAPALTVKLMEAMMAAGKSPRKSRAKAPAKKKAAVATEPAAVATEPAAVATEPALEPPAPPQHFEPPTWDVIDRYFMQGGGADCANPLVKHQVDSYNEFLDKKITQIIHGFNAIQICHNYSPELGDFTYKIYINVNQPSRSKPMYTRQDGSQILMTPQLARMNNLTYAANLYADIHIITESINRDGITERNESTIPSVPIGKVPIMVRSKACVLSQMPVCSANALSGKHASPEGECRYDPGGYFIVNGNEKVVICQDRISENRTLVFAPNGNADGISAEIRSMPDGVFLPPKTTNLLLSGKANHLGRTIRLSTSFLRADIPLFVMFRALGIETDRDIIQHILLDPADPKNARLKMELLASAEEASDIYTAEQAHTYLLRILGTTGTPKEYMEQPQRARAILRDTIANDFLPHVGTNLRKKALYLGYMCRKLLRIYLGYQDYDNRDSYIHKRIDTTGVLFSNLFRQCYGKMIKEMRNLVVRELNQWRANAELPTGGILTPMNIHRFFKQTLIESGLRYALSTGNWGVKTLGSFQNIRQGVAQVLNRMSYLSTLSHLRRINTPMEKNGKLVQPRKLENTQFGMICPNETPEGASVGLVKNMAMSTGISIGTSSAHIREVLAEMGVRHYENVVDDEAAREFLAEMGGLAAVQVVINGDILGYTTTPKEVYDRLKSMKRTAAIPPTTALVWDIQANTLAINTEAGRMYRPLYISEDGRLRLEGQIAATEGGWPAFSDRKYMTHFIAPASAASAASAAGPPASAAEGFLEYLDTEEVDRAMIAMTPADLTRGIKGTTLPPNFTHCEIHPSLMNGVLAANIPFMDHNQAPRNCYQCLNIEEPVQMSDGSLKRIADVREGDEVLTFSPTTLQTSISRVIHQYQRPAEQPMMHVRTISGRVIAATQDHRFMTSGGNGSPGGSPEWRPIFKFEPNTRVAIWTGPAEIMAKLSSAPPAPAAPILAEIPDDPATTQRLTEMGLLPLTPEHPAIQVFMRIFGYYKARGMHPTGLAPEDAADLATDIAYIGFTEWGAADTGFVAMMRTLEVDRILRIPDWILTTSTRARYEFLRGYLGGRGQETWVAKILTSIRVESGLGITATSVIRAYSTAMAMQAAIAAEYARHLRYAKEARFPPMSAAAFEATVSPAGSAMLWVPVARITPLRHCIVADITVESANHSFIGGESFAVSNSAMGKQAVGIYASNYNERIDTMAHVLNYPQKPLTHTKLAKYTNSDALPSGFNAVVAIMTHTGFNQEDSVMINRSSLDRGLFTSTYYKSYRDQCSRNHSTGEEEIFTRPDIEPGATGLKPYNYDKLGDDGLVPKNTPVNGNDILIGKMMPVKMGGTSKDNSHVLKSTDEGNVDMNYIGLNNEGYKFAKVRLRQNRRVQIGHKCASRSAQKGTVGMIYPQQDMPFTKDGIVPDIIMNPHAIPSRMTISQVMECLMGKACCQMGALGDATPFNDCSVEDLADILEGFGMQRHGDEILYNGRTGEMIQTEIFIGPTFYQRLKHMTEDKAHSRGFSGPVVLLTRQPAEGRARNGGLRFGEMERDAIVAHGASAFVKERMLDTSDNYRVFVCRGCGLFATANPEKNIYKCAHCKNNANIVQVRIPYAMKLLMQELMTMGIAPRMKT